MVKINKIYTRTGDRGDTGLVGGARVSKDSLRVKCYGEVDELNSILGWAATLSGSCDRTSLTEKLSVIQNELFDIGSELATPPGSEWEGMQRTEPAHVRRLELWIDATIEGLPELRSFVLPGGTELNSVLHLGRTVCRRVERSLVELSRAEPVSEQVLIYFNRLSDLLFAMARRESFDSGVPEFLWIPGKDRSPG